LNTSFIPHGKFRSPHLSKATAAAKAALYPFLPVCAVFLHVQTMVWLPVFGAFNVHTNVDAYDCTEGCINTMRESALKSEPFGLAVS